MQRLWHGLLAGEPGSADVVLELLPLYEQAFSHIQNDLGHYRDRLSYHMAVTAAHYWREPGLNPVQSGWLARFLTAGASTDRARWATFVQACLEALPEAARTSAWDGWMSDYLLQRQRGQPMPMDSAEYEPTVSWLASLDARFDAAVERIVALPTMQMQHIVIFHELLAKDFHLRHPGSITRLLIHLLTAAKFISSLCYVIDPMVEHLLTASVPREDLEQLLNQTARLRCIHAAAFRERIIGSS